MAEKRDARGAALYVLSRSRRFDAWTQQTLEAAAQKFSLGSRDKALCSRLCSAVLQNAALCDWYIGCYSSVPPEKLEPAIRDILRIGICQILFMDRIPVSAAVNESVRLAREKSSRAAGLVNAVLRRISENKDALPEITGKDEAEKLSIKYSHPRWLCEKILAQYGYDFAEAYLSANNREPETDISVNRTRTDREKLLKMLTDAGIRAERSELSDESIRLFHPGKITDLPGFEEGLFFVQDASAALAAKMAGAKPGCRVLDACAAPGGKSFLCASLMNGEGEILSCDLHAGKLDRIEESAERLGFDLIRTAPMDASRPYDKFYDGFDIVIADVPCSGLGVIRKKPEIRYKDQKAVGSLPDVQLRILQGLSACVRRGGTLLYSTCTILREENEGVVSAFLNEHTDFRQEEMRTIWPQEYGTDGFFMCRMKRYD